MNKFTKWWLAAVLILGLTAKICAAEPLTCWFPPDWKSKPEQAAAIAGALSKGSGSEVRPRIAKSYPEILGAFATNQPNLVYVGSFVQAMIKARGLGTPLVQNIDGKEFYSGVMVYPKDQDPESILKNSPEQIAYAVATDSGESAAKAATGGKAAMGVGNHGAASAAVEAGKAKAAFVKNWWWQSNKDKFPKLAVYEVPGVSVVGNPDNILAASNGVPVGLREKITAAAIAGKEAFGAPEMRPFDPAKLDFSLELMKKGGIDPLTYSF